MKDSRTLTLTVGLRHREEFASLSVRHHEELAALLIRHCDEFASIPLRHHEEFPPLPVGHIDIYIDIDGRSLRTVPMTWFFLGAE